MPDNKTARWLDLLAYLLQYRFPVTRERIFASVRGYEGEFESARRKFERDKDELRDIGIDIETVPVEAAGDQPATGYRLKAAGFYLPYFELARAGASQRPYTGVRRIPLTDDELKALDRATSRLAQLEDSPLADAARTARRKLSFDLPLADDASERILTDPLPEQGRESLGVLQEAVASHTAVACHYYTISRDSDAERVLEPYGLFFQWGHWYCVARARDRNAVRVFRVDRMRDARTLEKDAFQVPQDFDIRPWLGRAPWEMGDSAPATARVRFTFPTSRWIENQRHGRQVGAAADDGSEVREFEVREKDAFLRWMLSFRGDAVLLEPTELVSELEALRARVAAIYADSQEAS
ncbi:MAG TPA: WYL domain-containing protein [Gemmatimonadales bacterium]|nr:WYL domain-containing protein [Gemmatimonadales bacterium]